MLMKPDGSLDLEAIAQQNLGNILRNLPTPVLVEEIIKNREGHLSHLGPVVVRTGHHTERSQEDKFIVKNLEESDRAHFSDKYQEMSQENFDSLYYRVLAYMQNKDVYVQNCTVCSHPDYRIPVRVVTETAWHSLFARNMFRQIHDPGKLENFKPAFNIVHVPGFQAIPEIDGTRSSAVVIMNLAQKVAFIGGTSYAGEITQAMFTVTNHLLRDKPVLSLNCAANLGPDGEVAIFMGRTGTGKTCLATDPDRTLIGDHEHGWTGEGLFNFEWGCYAKVMNLDPQHQPLIHECTRKFGTILENVTLNGETRRLQLDDDSLTPNTRASYPITHIPNASREGTCGHPRHIFMLTCDAFGVLPPIARLTPEQAVFALLSAYTSIFYKNSSGSEEPYPVFSLHSGAAPLGMSPHQYAEEFLKRINQHHIDCWLMNTGWVGDDCGRSDRIPIPTSRALVRAALSGELAKVDYQIDPVFGFQTPASCPGVPADILNPRLAASDEGDYEVRANRLIVDFVENFRMFGDKLPRSVLEMVNNIPVLEESLDMMEQFDLSI